MILGGLRYALPVIKAAHEMGVYVITCDYLPDNIAHRYSDEYCNVSIVDKEAVLEKARELNIDGITSFACDPGVVTAAYVAEKMGLPSVGSYESVCILQNKGRFRKFMAENGFQVPNSKSYRKVKEALEEVDYFHWPVIVKPVDSAGSKGVTKVTEKEQLAKAIAYALEYSISKEFIIEDYLEKKGCSSDTDAFSVDGKMRFISFNAQLFDTEALNPHTPAGFYWKATISQAHQEELRKEIQRMVTLLGLKSSLYNIEARECTDGKAYIMELSPRGGGNRLSECLEMATGVKLIENMIRAAIGMDIIDIDEKPYQGNWAEAILHSDESGRFKSVTVSPEIEKYVVEKDIWVKEGDMVEGFSGASNTIGTIIFKFEDASFMETVMQDIRKYVKVNVK